MTTDAICEAFDREWWRFQSDNVTAPHAAYARAWFDAGWQAATKVQQARIEYLEAESLEHARLDGMGSEREAGLLARVQELEKVLGAAEDALAFTLPIAEEEWPFARHSYASIAKVAIQKMHDAIKAILEQKHG